MTGVPKEKSKWSAPLGSITTSKTDVKFGPNGIELPETLIETVPTIPVAVTTPERPSGDAVTVAIEGAVLVQVGTLPAVSVPTWPSAAFGAAFTVTF